MTNSDRKITDKISPDELHQTLKDMHDEMSELLAIMDFYQEIVDIVQRTDDPANLGSGRQKYGMFLVAAWMIKRGEELADNIDQIKNQCGENIQSD